jgi:hypothetical protein
MVRMRAASSPVRFAWAALFALLLAVRSLAPAGLMPAFDRGAVTIIACPDANVAVVPVTHHHHHPADHSLAHQPCPYAAASSLGALGPDWTPLLLAAVFFAVALLLGRTFLFIERQGRYERPPAIGPPIPA